MINFDIIVLWGFYKKLILLLLYNYIYPNTKMLSIYITATYALIMTSYMPSPTIQRVPTIQANLVGKITPIGGISNPRAHNKIPTTPKKIRLITEIPELKSLIYDTKSARLSLLSNMLENAYVDININTNETKYDF